MAAKKGKVVYSRRKGGKKESLPISQKSSVKASKESGRGGSLLKGLLWVVIITIGVYGIWQLTNNGLPEVRDYAQLENYEPMQETDERDKILEHIKIRKANIQLSETAKFIIEPKDIAQEISYDEKTSVYIPAGFSKEKQVLSVSKASIDQENMIEGADPLCILDLTLENGNQPSRPVEVSFQYYISNNELKEVTADQLEAYRWDEENGSWVVLPILVDEENFMVATVTDHFTLIAILIVNKVYKGLKDASTLGEYLLNDFYYTEHFKILYSEKEIRDHNILDDGPWSSQSRSNPNQYKVNYPHFVQDLGSYLENSLNRYENAGMFNPAKKTKGFLGTYNKKIKVKLGSYVSHVLGDPYYDKVYHSLHIPLNHCLTPEGARITLAHELFHRLQYEIYGTLGMAHPANKWFLEATAEYAAYDIAWPQQIKEMIQGVGNNYLTFPLNDRGSKKGKGVGWTDREYDYVTSIWIKFLTNFNVDLVKLLQYDANDNYTPKHSMNRFLQETSKKTLTTYYRGFTHSMLFSDNSPLKKFPLATEIQSNRDIATHQNTIDLNNQSEITKSISVDDILSSRLWAIKVLNSQTDKFNANVVIEIKEKEVPWQIIDVFIIDKGKRYLKPIKPIHTLNSKGDKALIQVKDGDHIYVPIINGLSTGGDVMISIKKVEPKLSISPNEILDATPHRQYSFELKAEDLPDLVKLVNFEWDFSDHKSGSMDMQSDVKVNNGSCTIKINHEYESSNKSEKFALKVYLKETHSGAVLAYEEALIILPNQPTVFITEKQLTGPPGATFDMEALASPKGKYEFVWEVERMAEAFREIGSRSGYAPVIEEKGTYGVVVKLYDKDGQFLAQDESTIYVEGNNDVQLLVYQVLLENPFNYSEDGEAVLKEGYETAQKAYVGSDVWVTTNLLQEPNKYIWRIDGQLFETVDLEWILMLRCGEGQNSFKDYMIGLGHHKIEVEVYNLQNQFVGKDAWEITVEKIPDEPLDLDSGMYPEADTGKIGG